MDGVNGSDYYTKTYGTNNGSNTPSSSQSNKASDSTTEQLIDREQLKALLQAVKDSRTLFEDDYNDLINASNSIDTTSRMLVVGAGKLIDWLVITREIGISNDEYENKISEIRRILGWE